MNTNKLLSALAYLSIFFLGFIFPAVLYFVADDGEVKRHAAFLSHCIPVAAIFIAFLFVFALGFGMDGMGAGRMIGLFVIMGLAGLVSLAVTIWNVVKAVQILTR